MKHNRFQFSMTVLVFMAMLAIMAFDASPARGLAGVTERVSVSSTRKQANDNSLVPLFSADGRFATFTSYASNLVSGDTNGVQDAFVHDRVTGLTERVSISSSGEEGNDYSWAGFLSADGRYVMFNSTASNLVSEDTNDNCEFGYIPYNCRDVFVHDRQTGVTERVSVSSTGEQGNADSLGRSTSADGRFVAFESYAANLVGGDANGAPDVFVHDHQTGVTERVSVSSSGEEGDDPSWGGSLSADGRFVAFTSDASNLVSGDTNGMPDIFVRDRLNGLTERVSVSQTGEQGGGGSIGANISADGRFVAFVSQASNLVSGDNNGEPDVFVHDRQTGETERVSVSSSGEEGNKASGEPFLSGDGLVVAFYSSASNLVSGDTNGNPDSFVHNRRTGVTERVSVSSGGAQSVAGSLGATISANGRFVGFFSTDENLVSGDTNGKADSFVREWGLSLLTYIPLVGS